MAESTAQRLGYGPEARLVIFHADDVGMCHGSNVAFVELAEAGIVQSGSIMAPCPWATEMVRLAQANPALDVGVHLTLTCEWPDYRWGPMTTRAAESGLVRRDGSFWPSTAEVHEHADVAAAAVELRAQVEWVVESGVQISHLDSHMGVNWAPPLFTLYAELGHEHHAPIFFAQSWESFPQRDLRNQELRTHALEQLAAHRLPPVDFIRITPCYAPQAPAQPSPEVYEEVLRGVGPGITHFALHPNAPGEIETIDRHSAQWRIFEYEYFRSSRLREFLEQEQIIPFSYGQICTAMREGRL
jgi:predicted glycoside hydrolase/deacetylase ChbG (UPF0249 family)